LAQLFAFNLSFSKDSCGITIQSDAEVSLFFFLMPLRVEEQEAFFSVGRVEL